MSPIYEIIPEWPIIYRRITVMVTGDCYRKTVESQMEEEGWEFEAIHEERDWIRPPEYEFTFVWGK